MRNAVVPFAAYAGPKIRSAIGSRDLDREHDCSNQSERKGERPPDVAMEETGVSRSLGEEGKGEEVRNDQHGGGQEIRSREVGDLRR